MVVIFFKPGSSNDKYSVLGANEITVEELQKWINALHNNTCGSITNISNVYNA